MNAVNSSREARETIRSSSRRPVSHRPTNCGSQFSAPTRCESCSGVRSAHDALTQDGDGLSVAELTAECSGIDLDAIAAKDQTVTEECRNCAIG